MSPVLLIGWVLMFFRMVLISQMDRVSYRTVMENYTTAHVQMFYEPVNAGVKNIWFFEIT